MGNNFVKYLAPQNWKQDEPDSFAPIKYDPQFGFENWEGRVVKPCSATEEEMDSANLPEELRNQCAHLRIHLKGCLHRHFPLSYKCKGLINEVHDCLFAEHIDDMKEFERERRLNARERRLKEKASG